MIARRQARNVQVCCEHALKDGEGEKKRKLEILDGGNEKWQWQWRERERMRDLGWRE